MSSSPSTVERDALEGVERQLIARGYSVLREPHDDQLPAFMRGFRPDAIATGKHPNLIVEVMARRGPASVEAAKVSQLRQLVAGQDDWSLEIVYTAPSIPDLGIATSTAIRDRLGKVRALAAVDRPAALIMVWSLLEAVARALLPTRAGRPLTPASTVELLASMGYVDSRQAVALRQAGRLRNVVVHGDLTREVSIEELKSLLRIVEQLVAKLEAQPTETLA